MGGGDIMQLDLTPNPSPSLPQAGRVAQFWISSSGYVMIPGWVPLSLTLCLLRRPTACPLNTLGAGRGTAALR
jgi:hypothetical protein